MDFDKMLADMLANAIPNLDQNLALHRDDWARYTAREKCNEVRKLVGYAQRASENRKGTTVVTNEAILWFVTFALHVIAQHEADATQENAV
jgi:hypothetical protein